MPQKIYINENLIAQRVALFKKARDKISCDKDGKYGPPTGNIFVKPDLSLDYIIRINSVEALEKL